MAEYRTRVHEEFLARQEARNDQRKAAKAEREIQRKISREAQRLASIEQSRKWRLANPGKNAAAQKVWREANRDKVLAHKRARKAAKRVTLTRELTKLQRGRCAYCRIKLGDKFHVDHVTPLKRGGPDHRSNLQLTCENCNLIKHAKDPIDFARSTGRLL